MKLAKTFFCIVALTLVAQQVAGHSHLQAHAWEFQPQRCSPKPQNLRRQLLCSDPDLRRADIALSKAYQEKIAQLEPSQVDALRSDSRAWWTYSCVGDGAFNPPLAREAARTCLKQTLPQRRQFVLALPTDRPKAGYLFSQTELALLRTYLGKNGGPISGIANDHDALAVSLRRVFAAVLSKPEPPYERMSETADDFLKNASHDTAALEDGRYFVDTAGNQLAAGTQGMFVVDLETGETTLAFVYDEVPSLEIWLKECASQSFQNESFTLFQKYVLHVATWSAVTSESQADSQTLYTPCK